MVLGAVDGTHIPIMQPYVNSQDYFSYKMKYTLNVQSVCDYSGKFIDVDIRWPGATHDAKVFSYSSINGVLKEWGTRGTDTAIRMQNIATWSG